MHIKSRTLNWKLIYLYITILLNKCIPKYINNQKYVYLMAIIRILHTCSGQLIYIVNNNNSNNNSDRSIVPHTASVVEWQKQRQEQQQRQRQQQQFKSTCFWLDHSSKNISQCASGALRVVRARAKGGEGVRGTGLPGWAVSSSHTGQHRVKLTCCGRDN